MSKHLVDPEILPALDMIPPLDFSAGLAVLKPFREAMDQMRAAMPKPQDDGIGFEDITIPGPKDAPSLRVLIYTPPGAKSSMPAVLDIHGGGYIIGSADIGDVPNRMLAKNLGCVVVSVDYRLAPETPHPGPVEDCYAALKWLFAEAGKRGIDPKRIGVKGDSAGGGLAAGLALLARDRGELPLAFQYLIYPMIDDRTCVHPDPHPHTGQYVWSPANNRFGWASLLGVEPGSPGVSPYAAAARAEDVSNLPPAFISVGALDLFVEEDIEYARRLMRAGVPVELHVYPGAFHGFNIAAEARITKAAARDGFDWLKRAMHG